MTRYLWPILLACCVAVSAHASEALLIGGSAYVPIRAVAAWLGGESTYDTTTQDIRIDLPAQPSAGPDGVHLVNLESQAMTARVRAGSATAWVDTPRWMYVDPDAPPSDDPVPVALPGAVIVRRGTSYIPVRGLTPLLRADFTWHAATRTIVITHARASQPLTLVAHDG